LPLSSAGQQGVDADVGPEAHSRRNGEHSGRPGSALRVNLSAPLSSQGMNLSQEWRVRGVRIPAKAEIRNSKMTKNKP